MPQTIESKRGDARVSIHAGEVAEVRHYVENKVRGIDAFVAATLSGNLGAALWSSDARDYITTIKGRGEALMYLSPEQARVLAAELLAAADQLDTAVEVAA